MERTLVFSLLIFSALWAADERLENADNYFINRHRDTTYLSRSAELCEEVLKENPSDVEALWRMARNYSAFGYYESETFAKLAFYEKCKFYAELAKAADRSSADAHFWYGVGLSRIIQVRGLLQALSQGGEVKKAFQKALELDPNHTKAMGALAIWYLEAPRLAGGNVDRSIHWFKKGLFIDPNYTLLYVYLAKAHVKKKDYESARTQLNKCLAVKNPSCPADFYTQDEPQARKILKEIEGK